MAGPLIGNSVAFREVTEAIAMVAPVDSAVLLLGETGTGKELIARAIHDAGPRRHQRFVAVNCAAIPVSLLESELFGHERGAFTGAVSQTIGRFQAADGGTLFLDEVGDLPLELQPKLLRALQEQQVERLGSGGRVTSVDVRVIAATNQDLEQMVQQRAFRADLFYRLNVFPIRVPPLRERVEDIPLLVAHFVRTLAERQGKTIEEVPDEVMATLKRNSWPGNVRELQNVIERAVVATTGPTMRLPELGRRIDRAVASSRTLAQVERDHIVATLQATNWVLGGWDGAAAKLGYPERRSSPGCSVSVFGWERSSRVSEPASILAGCEAHAGTAAARWLIERLVHSRLPSRQVPSAVSAEKATRIQMPVGDSSTLRPLLRKVAHMGFLMPYSNCGIDRRSSVVQPSRSYSAIHCSPNALGGELRHDRLHLRPSETNHGSAE